MATIKKRETERIVLDRKTGRERVVKTARWRARFVNPDGNRVEKLFLRQADAQRWIDEQTAATVGGRYVAPDLAKLTAGQWIDMWLKGYASRRPGTVKQAKTHIVRIRKRFGDMRLDAVRPTHVKSWVAELQDEINPHTGEPLEASYVYALHSRLAQLYNDAIADRILAWSPCSRKTAPPTGEQVAYVATDEQLWDLHDAMPEHLRAAVLLGAFAGARLAEACGLRLADIDFMRETISFDVQYPEAKLKTKASRATIDIPHELALWLSAHVAAHPAGEHVMPNEYGAQLAPWTLSLHFRRARGRVKGLPEGFRFHDLRHYLASTLIADGADAKVVQARLRHASTRVTFDVYGHLWPDKDTAAKKALGKRIANRPQSKKAVDPPDEAQA